MSETSRCRLTTKDFSILQGLRERGAPRDEAYLRLLRRKLSEATVAFQDDIGADVATLDSRVGFTVGAGPTEDRVLVHGSGDTRTDLALCITSLRGLAVLGLSAGETIAVERADGVTEELRLERVSQPGAGRGKRRERDGQDRAQNDDAAPTGRAAPVVMLAARRKPAGWLRTGPADPDDDDPGPRAA